MISLHDNIQTEFCIEQFSVTVLSQNIFYIVRATMIDDKFVICITRADLSAAVLKTARTVYFSSHTVDTSNI